MRSGCWETRTVATEGGSPVADAGRRNHRRATGRSAETERRQPGCDAVASLPQGLGACGLSTRGLLCPGCTSGKLRKPVPRA